MTDVMQFVAEEWKYLRDLQPDLHDDPEKHVYAQATKLGEETGELNEALLAHFGRQRKGKTQKETNVSEEMADIILVIMLMAVSLDIDIEQALHHKMTAIRSRQAAETQ